MTGYRVNPVQEYAVEALLLLDRYQDAQAQAEALRQHADDFWHEFIARVAARTNNPFDALAKMIPELGLTDEEGTLPAEKEADLPPPTFDEIADIERWMAEHSSGSITGDELPGTGGESR